MRYKSTLVGVSNAQDTRNTNKGIKDYKLLSLLDLEKFINENHHLPGMPTANEIEKEGQDLGNMEVKLLKQNEELTLRIIELNKRVEFLEKRINKNTDK